MSGIAQFVSARGSTANDYPKTALIFYWQVCMSFRSGVWKDIKKYKNLIEQIRSGWQFLAL